MATYTDLKAANARLLELEALLAAKSSSRLSVRHTDASKPRKNAKGETVFDKTNGRLVVYGIQRFPATYSLKQWQRIRDEVIPQVLEYYKRNEAEIKRLEAIDAAKGTAED
jgi:hypothetical protein